MRKNMNLKMQRAINDSMRANNSYWFASRVFGIYISYVSIAMAAIGVFIGIKTAKDPGIYGVAIVFILQLIDFIQWLLRQLVNMESIMVSVERAYLIAHLPDEGPLRTEYDEKIGFKDEI
jgi:ATP-binding cassette subfamily C (CFTR/MRP) protein 4